MAARPAPWSVFGSAGCSGRRQQRVHQAHALTDADGGSKIAALLHEIAGEPVRGVTCAEVTTDQPRRLGGRRRARAILGQMRRHGVQQRLARDWKQQELHGAGVVCLAHGVGIPAQRYHDHRDGRGGCVRAQPREHPQGVDARLPASGQDQVGALQGRHALRRPDVLGDLHLMPGGLQVQPQKLAQRRGVLDYQDLRHERARARCGGSRTRRRGRKGRRAPAGSRDESDPAGSGKAVKLGQLYRSIS